jgi:hypothetical protein
VTISSAQATCYTSYDDTITISSPTTTDTITFTGGSSCYSFASASTYTINTVGIPGLTTSQISALNTSCIPNITINFPEEFVNTFPDWRRIEKMCKEYPGLKIAFEKFKTTYLLVKDHYDTPEDQRPRP